MPVGTRARSRSSQSRPRLGKGPAALSWCPPPPPSRPWLEGPALPASPHNRGIAWQLARLGGSCITWQVGLLSAPEPTHSALARSEEASSCALRKAGALCGHERKQTCRAAPWTDVGSDAVPCCPWLISPRMAHPRCSRRRRATGRNPDRQRRLWREQGLSFRDGDCDRHSDERRGTSGRFLQRHR